MSKRPQPADVISPESQGQVTSENVSQAGGFYSSDANRYYLDSSLEVKQQGAGAAHIASNAQQKMVSFRGLSGRKAMVVSCLIAMIVTGLTGTSMLFLARSAPDRNNQPKIETQDVALTDAAKSELPKELQGADKSLLVNGDVITRGVLKVASNSFVTVIKSAELTSDQTFVLPNGSGTICLDSNNCNNASLDQLNAANARLANLQAQLGQLESFVDGIDVTPSVPGGAGVDALNGQDGTVSIQGSINRVSVNTAGGVITLSTPQDLDANANVQFGSLSTNNITQTGAGNNVSISAGNDMLTLTSNGRTFNLPAIGPGSQTICTSAVNCAAGGGEALLLAPNSVQTDSSSNSSIFINDTGGGNLIEIQRSSVARMTLNNSGDLTISGGITVQGLTNGFVKASSGSLSVVSAIDLASGDVTGTLPVTQGGIGVTTLASNQLLLGNGTSGVGTVGAGISGQCLIANNSAAPTFQTCPGSGGVANINAITGAVTLQGTTNQITVTNGVGTITLSTPQNIHNLATPTFAGLTLGSLNGVVRATAGVLSTGNVNLTNEVTGVLPIANGGTGISTTPSDGRLLIGNTATNGYNLTTLTAGGGISIINGNGSITISSPAAGTCPVSCADNALSNLAGVSINSSLLPDSTQTVHLGATNRPFQSLHLNSTAGAQGFFITGTNVSGSEVTLTLPVLNGTFGLVQTAGASTAQTGDFNVTGSLIGARVIGTLLGSNEAASTSTITLRSGNASAGNSGNILIDAGTATGTRGTVTIGGTNASAVELGRSGLAVRFPGGLTTLGANIATANGALTLGSGTITTTGLINSQNISATAMFSGTLTVGGGALAVGSDTNNINGRLEFIRDNGNVVSLNISPTSSAYNLTLPNALPGATSCVTLDNTGQIATQSCGSGIGGSGSDGQIPLFTGGGAQITDSIINQNTNTITIQGASSNLVVEGGTVAGLGNNSLTLGASSNRTGGIGFYNEDNANVATLQSGITNGSYTLTLPTDLDTSGQCLNVGAGGQIGYFPCISGGGGGGGSGVTANPGTTGRITRWVDGPNTQIGDSIIRDNGTGVGINVAVDPSFVLAVGSGNAFKVTNAGALTVNGITSNNNAGISSTGALAGVTTIAASGLIQTSATGQGLALTGTPTNSATQSLIQIGSPIASGNNSLNGGTYIGLNAPNGGVGSAADFINLQKNSVSLFRVTNTGAVNAGTYNGLTLQSQGGGFQVTGGSSPSTLTVSVSATINQDLSTTSAVTFDSLTLTTALAATSGGTGLSGAPSADGQLLIGSAGGAYALTTLTEGAGIDIVNGPNTITISALGAGTCAGCAAQDLGNLNNVAIAGDDLKPATAGAIDLGTSTKAFGDLFIAGTSSTPATNRFRITGVATGSRTINLPDLTAASQEFVVAQTAGASTAQTGDIRVTSSLISGVDVQTTYLNINNTSSSSTALISASNNNAGYTGNLLDLRYGNPSPTSQFTVTRTGAVTIAGNITANGGGPNTFANSLQVTSGTIQAPTVNASTTLQVGGVDVNTAGTLSNVAYENQANTFTVANNVFSASGTALSVTNNATIGGTASIGTLSVSGNGTIAGGSLTLGASAAAGSVALYDGASGINAHTGSVNVAAGLGQNTTYTLPDPGVSTAEVCVKYSGSSTNCAGIGGGLSGSGSGNHIAYFSGASTLSNSIIAMSGNNIVLDQGNDRNFNIAQASSGVGYVLTIQAGQGATSGNQVGGNLLLQSGAGGGSGSQGEVIVRSNGTNTQQAFSIQKADNTRLLTADTTNMRVSIGTGTVTLGAAANGNLFVGNTVELAAGGILRIGNVTDGVSFNDTTCTGCSANANLLRLRGTARNTKTITLTPEFAGVTLLGDGVGSDNTGFMLSNYDGTRNYYEWSTNEATPQDYDIVVQIPLPSDFDAFATSTPITIDRWSSNNATGTITALLKDTANANATNWNTCSQTPGSSSTWTTTAGCIVTGGTFAADGVMTLRLNVRAAASGGTTRIGNIKITYLSKF